MPHDTEHGVQSVHSVTTQSTISDEIFSLFDTIGLGCLVGVPVLSRKC